MAEKTAKKSKIYDIHCPSCGSPAYFDIKRQIYNCQYCGGTVKIDRPIKDHQGFRKIWQNKMKKALKDFELQKSVCTGCGAQLVFDKNEAVANCAFCGRSLVRKAFVNSEDIPELIIPFSVLDKEARELLEKWCLSNRHKKEAKAILKKLDDLKGCYLPYELIRGPVSGSAYRYESGLSYKCGGFVDKIFVNCSKDLNNRLLDAMEPYDLDGITEFDYAYIAGHQVKIGDISEDELERRIRVEIEDDYTPEIQKTFETKAVCCHLSVSDVVRMPVLLPVYYLSFDGFMAAVNGQTGKVSVLSFKDSYHIILPWWLKATFWTIAGTFIIAAVMFLCRAERDLILGASGCLGFFLFIVLLVAYSENREHEIFIEAGRKIYKSKGGAYVRQNGKLVQTEEIKEQTVAKPLYFMNINGREENVEIRFTSFLRIIKTLAITLFINFFIVILALFVNGFHFSMINLGGSAVWFCITVPLTPVLLVKYGRIELYENPWIYTIDSEGRRKRYKEKFKWDFTAKDVFKTVLKGLFKPPVCFLVWFIIAVFCGMVYLTAFGDW